MHVRPATYGDVAILIPSRTVLDALEDALEEASVPYRTESSSLAYASREVRSLLLALRAVDDPSDELALLSTLRSPLFGCSDPELYRWVNGRGGRWSVLPGELPPADGDDDTVRDAVGYLQGFAADRHWATPSELLDRLIRDRRVLEVSGHGRRARYVWRRLRYLVDQARVWREAGGGTLREYLEWAYRQATDSVRVTEAVLPETDHDAVRIMTVHAAKGLEFPIVVLAGLTTRPRRSRRRSRRHLDAERAAATAGQGRHDEGLRDHPPARRAARRSRAPPPALRRRHPRVVSRWCRCTARPACPGPPAQPRASAPSPSWWPEPGSASGCLGWSSPPRWS